MKLSHVRYGDGRPVVLLHGLFGSARNWAGIARRLGEDHAVYVLDARNHGDSPRAAAMGYADMADDVGEFIADHGLERPLVMGHSMGGKTAMTLALGQGGAIGGLIVADIAPVAYPPRFMAELDAMRAIDPAGLARRGDAEAAMAQAVPDPAVRAFLLHNLVAQDGGYAWRIDLGAIAANAEALAGFAVPAGASYRGPALFLRGDRSDYVAPTHHAGIRDLFPAAEIETIADSGHWLYAEQPDAFLTRVRDWLSEIRAERRRRTR